MIDYAFSIYELEYFLLILVRVSCFIYICPFFSMNNTPRRVRAALSIFISALLYEALQPIEPVITNTIIGYAVIVFKEAAAGLLIGLSANICASVFTFAGTIADMEIGLSMVRLMDPATRNQISITGTLFNYVYTMILIGSGMYRYLLGALADTYQLIPVNHVNFNMNGLLETVVTFLVDYVFIGFRIILPIFATMMMLNAILGIMAKVSPQMNMFAVGVQLKVMTGLSILILLTALMPVATDMVFEEMKKLMVSVVSNLM